MMLEGKVVAITGGAGLIGSTFVRAVVNQGGRVIIGDVDETKSITLEEELGKDNAAFIPVDATEPEAIEQFIEAGATRFGRIDAAVHCAYPRSSQWGERFEELQPEGLAEDLYRHLGGAILFSQKIIAYFRQHGGGNLIHLSSIQGVAAPKFEHYQGTSMVSPIEYSAIKAGIISITKYLAKYCKGENIRVNCISPGGILDKQPASFLKHYHDSCLSKGMLDADDLAGALLFFLSDQSLYVNGQNLIVDDGWIL
jgi:NAD(P)-dependent dehydrogenase (short-subunit alcohol dehydrogenase family)